MTRGAVSADRSSTRAAITAAAAELLNEGGASAVTTRAVAERAGVQAPTIYRLFGDKDGLIAAVAEAVMAAYVSSKQTVTFEDRPPVEALRAAWQRHIDFGLANPELYGMLSAPGHHEFSPATVLGIDVLRRLVNAMATAGLLVVSERRAVEMIHAAGSGVVLALLSQPTDERDLQLSDTMFEAVLGAIRGTHRDETDTTHDALAATIRFGAVVDDLTALSRAERELLGEWVSRCITSMEAP